MTPLFLHPPLANTLLPNGEKEGSAAKQRDDEGENSIPRSCQVRFAHSLTLALSPLGRRDRNTI
jgi:hypothetical protein